MENNKTSKAVLAVSDWFIENNFNKEIVWLDETARSAEDAAHSLGCKVAEIAKSLVFKIKNNNEAVLVIASGVNKVNEEKLSKLLEKEIEKPDAVFVKEKTGFSIGGVSPVAQKNKIKVFIDEDLFKFEKVWAAAGHPNAVFATTPYELVKMTDAKIISVL